MVKGFIMLRKYLSALQLNKYFYLNSNKLSYYCHNVLNSHTKYQQCLSCRNSSSKVTFNRCNKLDSVNSYNRKFSFLAANDGIKEDIRDLIVFNTCSSYTKFVQKKHRKVIKPIGKGKPSSVCLKYINDEENENFALANENILVKEDINETVNFPYTIKLTDSDGVINFEETSSESRKKEIGQEDIQTDGPHILKHQFSKYGKKWMNDYEQYTKEPEEADFEEWRLDYGTADPNVPVSKTPCGGCGALLHCQDPSIPGYLPTEIFMQCTQKDLISITCQRCHFMKFYNTALSISVDQQLYPKLLSNIKDQHALVMMMVDLTDFPCSVWPGILDVIGKKRPLFIIGNKVDLLWGDSKNWVNNAMKLLRSTFPTDANIQHICLISAKTGFGIEELINKLHNVWQYKGDVYLIGCTNVGKSTLFNALLQSDYCKVKAVDLIQRATTSLWPGTTLNLLKFPILRPDGWRLHLRTLRLLNDQKKISYEKKVRKEIMKATKTKETAPTLLIGHIGRTFNQKPQEKDGEYDNFSVPNKKQIVNAEFFGSGLDPNDPDFKKSRWFYDTPGVVHADQILDLLTTEELMLTLPKDIIEPRTFYILPGWSIFIAGLARLDYFEGESPIRLTVFSSSALPITVCHEKDAEQVYNELLGSEYMKVPIGTEKRLKEWPNLKKSTNNLSLIGLDSLTSCADIILSSAGWISVTANAKQICKFKPWTPLARGIHVRTPSLLPNAVNLRGKRIRGTPAYTKSKPFLN